MKRYLLLSGDFDNDLDLSVDIEFYDALKEARQAATAGKRRRTYCNLYEIAREIPLPGTSP